METQTFAGVRDSLFYIGVAGLTTDFDFNGTTLFNNNHTGRYGGAIDMWGGNRTLVFNGDTIFTNNYTYSIVGETEDFPNHVTDRSASGGAIHVGFIDSSGSTGTLMTFNGNATFDGNFVNDLKTTACNNAQGGVIGLNQSRETGNRNYNLYMKGHSVFNNNYVYSLNGNGYGGAIYVRGGAEYQRQYGRYRFQGQPSGTERALFMSVQNMPIAAARKSRTVHL